MDKTLEEEFDGKNLNGLGEKDLGDELVKIATQALAVSNKYKEPLLEKWKMYEDLKAGKVKKKLRSQFNVALPVFSGMLDTLAADFDEPVELEFKKRHPSDFFKARKYQAAWNQQRTSSDKDAKWDYKSRVDKSLNILHGRSFIKCYAFSDPKYHSVLDIPDPLDMHPQPKGGGILENHLFCQQEGILRTIGDIDDSSIYDKSQVRILKDKSNNKEYINDVTDYVQQKLQRFKAIGLDPDSNDYVGEQTFNLCEAVITNKGKRWYVLYDPWTMTWLRFARLKDIFSKDLMPWVSWATFEDNKVFWTQGYADIAYPVADAVVTLFNQELTNREKQNMNARAYDKDMFTDVSKLDAAQYRPDALVPADTKGGTRKISEGIYAFQTPELTGTVNLIDWVNTSVKRDIGINDISQGAAMDAQKKVGVAYMETASISKRIGYKSQSYTEAWGEVGARFMQGLKDHMTEDMYIEVLGDMGIEPDVMTREDLDTEADLGIEVVSSTSRKSELEKKKQKRLEGWKLLAQSQNINSEMKDAAIMRDLMDYSEEEIRQFLDTKNYSAKESVAKAHIAIQELLAGDEPELNYSSDVTFLKTILDYSMDHRNKLGVARFKKFAMYIAKNAKTAQENAKRSGAAKGQQNARMSAQRGGKPAGAPAKPGMGGKPAVAAAPSPEMAQSQMQ